MSGEFNCDFNAPMFVDFENLDQEQEGLADAFFDTNVEEEPTPRPKVKDLAEELPPELPPRAAESITAGPLKPINRQVTPGGMSLRPRDSPASSLKSITKSASKQKTISREQAAQIVQRLCPSNATVLNKPKFVSMAEENKKFFGTPDRFRKKPRASSVDAHRVGQRKRSPSPQVRKAVFATMPQSPMLRTRGRVRCNHQAEEQEKTEAAKRKPEPTAESKLAALRKRVATLTSKPVIHHTATSKAREEKAKNTASSSHANGAIKQPLKPGRQHYGVPIILSSQKRKEDKEEEKPKKPLVANSAQLKLYNMGKEIRDKLETNRVKAQEEAKRLATVKARPLGISKSPFLPKPSDRAPVLPLDPNLHTEMRSEERRHFDQHVKAKEAEMQALKIQEDERKERLEKLETIRMRQEAVHKPLPIKRQAPPQIQASDKPLTIPKTPRFSIRRRRRSQ